MTNKEPNKSQVVGRRIRTLRKIMGLSQSEIAAQMGFSYQQLQKYETGKSHITVDMLDTMSQVFEKTAEELLQSPPDSDLSNILKYLLAQNEPDQEPRESLDSLLQFASLKDRKVRESLIHLLQSVEAASKADARREDTR